MFTATGSNDVAELLTSGAKRKKKEKKKRLIMLASFVKSQPCRVCGGSPVTTNEVEENKMEIMEK